MTANMSTWPTVHRESGLVERKCPHGIGHPDPDSVAAMGEVERLRSGLRYVIELLGEDPDEHPHVSHLDLIAIKVGYLRGRADALAEREAAEAGEPGE